MHADRHLYHTADKSRLVEEGDADAAFLAYAPGDEVGEDDAATLKKKTKPADKASRPSRSK